MWPDDTRLSCTCGCVSMQRSPPVANAVAGGLQTSELILGYDRHSACVQRQDVAVCVVAVAHMLSALFLLNSFTSTLRDQQTHANH